MAVPHFAGTAAGDAPRGVRSMITEPGKSRVVCKLCWVSGRVQGVYYRGTAQSRARALGITGHARNLADGRVEVLACGEESQVRQFIDWLWIGPTAAHVTAVEVVNQAESSPPPEFTTR